MSELCLSEEIVDFALYRKDTISLDSLTTPSSEEDGDPLIDFVSSDYSLEDEVIDNIINEEILKRLNDTKAIKDRYKKVLECRFGLNGSEEYTL